MPYWQLYYHLVWSTKHREPVLVGAVEAVIHETLRNKAVALGAHVFALDGVADHVHVVAAIPPRLSVATFVGQIKAVASTTLNKSALRDTRFAWQSEYGAFSFDAKRLPHYIVYVERQKEHHAQQHTIPLLECSDKEPTTHLHDPSIPYLLTSPESEESWRHEFAALE